MQMDMLQKIIKYLHLINLPIYFLVACTLYFAFYVLGFAFVSQIVNYITVLIIIALTVKDWFKGKTDEQGFINLPRINLVTEFTDAVESGRSYEANLGAIEVTKSMMNQTLRIIT